MPGNDRKYEIAAICAAVAVWTLFFVESRSTLPSDAEAFDTRYADRIGDDGRFEHHLFATYTTALVLLPPADDDPGRPAARVQLMWPLDGSAVHLPQGSRPGERGRTGTLVGSTSQGGSLANSFPVFSLPDIGSVTVPMAALAMAVPIADALAGGPIDPSQAPRKTIPGSGPASGPGPARLPGPFHLFFTTEQPAGLAPVGEPASGVAGHTGSAATPTAVGAPSSPVAAATGLASSLASPVTSLLRRP